jgi:hypothetical protein
VKHSKAAELRSVHNRFGWFAIHFDETSDPLVLASSTRLAYFASNFIAFSKIELLYEVLADVDIAAMGQIPNFSAPHKTGAVLEYIEYSQIGFVSHCF